jgi:hypothetical protein
MLFFKKNKMIFETKNLYMLKDRGAAIFTMILLTVSISLIIILGFTTPLIREFQNARNNLRTTQSYYASEAGIEDAYYRIKSNLNISSYEQLVVGGATSSVSIVNDNGTKILSASSSVFSRVRKIQARVSKSVYSVDLQQNAIFAGAGGLTMNNGAEISGVSGKQGNVYSNGPIINGEVTGNAISASYSVVDPSAQSTICNSDVFVGKSSTQTEYAQSFIPSMTEKLSNISLYIKKDGSPSAMVKIVEDDGSNRPKTIALASTAISNVGTAYSWISVSFASLPVLTAGQKYWVIVDPSGVFSNKYFTWCKDASNSYAGGAPAYSKDWSNPAESWTAVTGDLTFKAYFGLGLGLISGVTVGGDAKANTILNSTVGRDAYYQTLQGGSVVRYTYPGSVDPLPLQTPISDSEIDLWKADALAGGTIGGTFTATTTPSTTLGPVSIDGSLVVSNGKTVIVNGTIHVTGNITLDNNSTIRCATAYGTNGCIIIADGTIMISNNGIAQGALGFPTSFIMFVSTKTGGSNVTAIDISNNVEAVILYAPYAKISVSNNADIAAAMGYKVDLSNNVDVTYKPELDTLNFIPTAGGGGDVWTINSWNEIE